MTKLTHHVAINAWDARPILDGRVTETDIVLCHPLVEENVVLRSDDPAVVSRWIQEIEDWRNRSQDHE